MEYSIKSFHKSTSSYSLQKSTARWMSASSRVIRWRACRVLPIRARINIRSGVRPRISQASSASWRKFNVWLWAGKKDIKIIEIINYNGRIFKIDFNNLNSHLDGVVIWRFEERHEPIRTVICVKSDQKSVIFFRRFVVVDQQCIQVRVKVLIMVAKSLDNLQNKTNEIVWVVSNILYISMSVNHIWYSTWKSKKLTINTTNIP